MNVEDMSDEEFEKFMNDWEKDADELDKKYDLSSDSEHYSEKKEIKISKKLSEKLGSYNMSGIEILVNFDNLIKKELEMGSCTDEKRLAISEKMLSLGNLLTDIYKITKSHRSNDEKKEKIEDLLGNVNILAFCANLSDEIQKTRQMLIEKARNATRNVQEETMRLCQEVDKDAINEVGEEKNIGNSGDMKAQEGNNTEEEKGLEEYQKVGIFNKLKNFIGEKSKKMAEKFGIIAKIKETYNSKKQKNDIEKIEDLTPDIKGNISEKRNESKKNIFHAGKKSMEKIKHVLDEVLADENEKEVTPNIIANVMDRIAAFSKDKKIGGLCKGVVKDIMCFAETLTYNVGDYVVDGMKNGIQSFREAKNNGIDR